MCFLNPLCTCPAQSFVSMIAQAVSPPCPCPCLCIPGGHSVHGVGGSRRVCCWPWQTPECPRGQGGTESLSFSLHRGHCLWLVCPFAVWALLLHCKATALDQAWSRRFGDVFVGQSHNEMSLELHIHVLSQHFCSPSLMRKVCVLSLDADKNREHFVIVIGCVEMLPNGMPFRHSLSCYPVDGDRLRVLPPVHFTHWIKDKIEAFLRDWIALKMSEYLGLKTYEIIYIF